MNGDERHRIGLALGVGAIFGAVAGALLALLFIELSGGSLF